jgi:UV DNA damage endonuclease
MVRFGYCCISLGINEGVRKVDQVSVNRGMVKRTFDSKGLPYASQLALANLKDTLKVINWNISKGIMVYRFSSDSLPWMTHYRIQDLPDYPVIEATLRSIGDRVLSAGIRVSFHPGPYCVLASENPVVVDKTIDELDKHAELMDLMGLPATHMYPINIHIGSTKPTRDIAAARFCENFTRLSESCRARLTVENDDACGQYSVPMLRSMVHDKTGVPIVADTLHHACFPDGQTWAEALAMAASTWDVRPLTHHSSSRKIHEDPTSRTEAHADFLYEAFNSCGIDVDVELECKQKDLATIRYIKEFVQS